MLPKETMNKVVLRQNGRKMVVLRQNGRKINKIKTFQPMRPSSSLVFLENIFALCNFVFNDKA